MTDHDGDWTTFFRLTMASLFMEGATRAIMMDRRRLRSKEGNVKTKEFIRTVGFSLITLSIGLLLLKSSATGQAAGQGYLSDDEIQKEIDRGRTTGTDVAKRLKKCDFNIGVPFGILGGTDAIFLTERDLIALASLRATSPVVFMPVGQPPSVGDVKQWPNPGAIHVILRYYEVKGVIQPGTKVKDVIQPGTKFVAPAIHMTMAADGLEVQPLRNSAPPQLGAFPGESHGYSGPTPKGNSYETVNFQYWFAFDIPRGARKLTATVIFPDGRKEFKTFAASKLK